MPRDYGCPEQPSATRPSPVHRPQPAEAQRQGAERDKPSKSRYSYVGHARRQTTAQRANVATARDACERGRLRAFLPTVAPRLGKTVELREQLYRRRPRRPPLRRVESVGMGVTSSMRPIFMPERASARSADWAPGPGVLVLLPPVARNFTCSAVMPISCVGAHGSRLRRLESTPSIQTGPTTRTQTPLGAPWVS